MFGFNPSIASSGFGSDGAGSGYDDAGRWVSGTRYGRRPIRPWHQVKAADLIIRHTVKGLRGNSRHTGIAVHCVSAESSKPGESTM